MQTNDLNAYIQPNVVTLASMYLLLSYRTQRAKPERVAERKRRHVLVV